MRGRKGRRDRGRGSMASAEPVCQGEPWCSLTQEACYGRVLLGLDMGMGRVWNARLTGSFVHLSLIHPITMPIRDNC